MFGLFPRFSSLRQYLQAIRFISLVKIQVPLSEQILFFFATRTRHHALEYAGQMMSVDFLHKVLLIVH